MTFDIDKTKVIRVETDIEGIDSSLLNFLFRISINGVSYGFPGELTDGILTISIPPLKGVLKNAKNGQHEAVLEASSILEDGSGYYNLLQKGNVSLKTVPSIKVNIEPEVKTVNSVKTSISSISDENVIPVVDKDVPKSDDPWEVLDQKADATKPTPSKLNLVRK